jgi:hypothetical protein
VGRSIEIYRWYQRTGWLVSRSGTRERDLGTWYCIDVGDCGEAYKPVRDTFDMFFKEAKLPRDMALFYIHDLVRNVIRVYLSPACRAVALAIDARPCDEPDLSRLNLLYGHYDAWRAVFPERDDAGSGIQHHKKAS